MRHVTIWCAIAIARLRGASIEFESDGGLGGGGSGNLEDGGGLGDGGSGLDSGGGGLQKGPADS